MLPAEQLRPKVERRGEQWRKYQGRIDPHRLVFIDDLGQEEHGAFAWLGAQRSSSSAKIPYDHWRTMTFLANHAP